MRSNDKVTAVGNALHRALGFLSASGVFRSMHSMGVFFADVFWFSVALWALPAARLLTVTYHMYYVLYILYQHCRSTHEPQGSSTLRADFNCVPYLVTTRA